MADEPIDLASRRRAPVVTPITQKEPPTLADIIGHMIQFTESLHNILIYTRSLETRLALIERHLTHAPTASFFGSKEH